MGTYTVEDILNLPDDAPRTELRDGVVIPVPAPTAGHQRIVGTLWRLLERMAPEGLTVLSAVGVMINQHNSVEPDVVVLRGYVESTHHFFPPRQCVVAVEVVSPSTQRRDRLEKPGLYANAGVPYYWRIEQNPTRVFAYELQGTAYELITDTTETELLNLSAPFEIAIDVATL